MSYDLFIWNGPTPASDESAAEFYEKMMDQRGDEPNPPAPSAEMVAFVSAATESFPDLDDDSSDDEDTIWAEGPLIGNAWGDYIYLTMTYEGVDVGGDDLLNLALAQGLNVFDPQENELFSPEA